MIEELTHCLRSPDFDLDVTPADIQFYKGQLSILKILDSWLYEQEQRHGSVRPTQRT